MTIKELSKYNNIKIEILQLQDTIRELETTFIGSSKIKEIHIETHNIDSPTERLAIKLANLKTKIELKKERLIDEAQKIEDFLELVEEEEIRIIIRERFLNGKTWEEIAKKMITDRSTPYYRLKKYLKANQNEKK